MCDLLGTARVYTQNLAGRRGHLMQGPPSVLRLVPGTGLQRILRCTAKGTALCRHDGLQLGHTCTAIMCSLHRE